MMWGGYWPQLSGAVPAKYADIVATAQGYIINYINSLIPADSWETIGTLAYYAESLVDVIATGLLGYMTSFDATMETIYKLNPDVDIVVMPIQNIYDGIKVNAMGFELDLGQLIGPVMDIANIYTAYLSPFAGKYYAADLEVDGEKVSHVDDYFNQLEKWGNEPTAYLENMADLLTMEGFVDTLDVYSGYLVKTNLKKQIYNEYYKDYGVIMEGLTYDDIIENANNPFVRNYLAYLALAEKMEKELAVRTQVVYYATAKAAKISSENKLASLDSLMSMDWEGETPMDEAVRLGYEGGATIDGHKTVEENLAVLLPQVDAVVTEHFSGEENEAKRESLYGGLAIGMFGAGVMIHRNDVGHEQCFDIVMDTYEKKINKQQVAIAKGTMIGTQLAIEAVGITVVEANKLIVDFAQRVHGILSGDEETIYDTVEDVSDLLHETGDLMMFLKPILDAVVEAGNMINSFFRLDGMIQVLKDNPIYGELISLVESASKKVYEVVTTSAMITDIIRVIDDTFIGDTLHFVEGIALAQLAPYINFVRENISRLYKMVTDAALAVASAAGFILANISALTVSAIGAVATGAVNTVKTVATSAFEAFKATTNFTVNSIVGAFGLAHKVTEFVGETAVVVATKVTEYTVSTALGLVNGLKSLAEDVVSTVINVVDFLIHDVDYIELGKTLAKGAYAFVKTGIDQTINTVVNTFKAIQNAYELLKDGITTALYLANKFVKLTQQATIAGVVNAMEFAKEVYEFIGHAGEMAVTASKALAGIVGAMIGATAERVAEISVAIYNGIKELPGVIMEVSQFIYEKVTFAFEVLAYVKGVIDFQMARIQAFYDAIPEKVYEEIRVTILDIVLRYIRDVNYWNNQVEGFKQTLKDDINGQIEHVKETLANMYNELVTTINGAICSVVTMFATAIGEVVGYASKTYTELVNEIVTTIKNDTKLLNTSVATLAMTFVDELIKFTQIKIDFDQDITGEGGMLDEAGNVVESAVDAVEQAEEAVEDAEEDIVEEFWEILQKWNLVPND